MNQWVDIYYNGEQVRLGSLEGELLNPGQQLNCGKARVELRGIKKGAPYLVRLSGKGHLIYEVTLSPRGGIYRLGPESGKRIGDIPMPICDDPGRFPANGVIINHVDPEDAVSRYIRTPDPW